MPSFGFKRHPEKAPPARKPLRIERKMIHGQMVDVKIFAGPGIEESVNVRHKTSRGRVG